MEMTGRWDFCLKQVIGKILWMKPDKTAQFMHTVQFWLGVSQDITEENRIHI